MYEMYVIHCMMEYIDVRTAKARTQLSAGSNISGEHRAQFIVQYAHVLIQCTLTLSPHPVHTNVMQCDV